MEEKRREELGLIVANFMGKAVTQKALDEFCNRIKIEKITVGNFADYVTQVEHDAVVSELYPEILAELQKLQYIPEFGTAEQRAKMLEENDDIRVNITKLFERMGVKYTLAEPIGAEIGDLISRTVANAGNTAFNKATEVLLHIASKNFASNHFTMAHVEKYARETFEKAEEDGELKGGEEKETNPVDELKEGE